MNTARDFIFSEHKKASVLIIGAGINGIGVFRDLSLQGIDVLLIDKGDFCSGTSAASTRNIHGGIRYLEYGKFRLVRESVHERNRLLNNCPQYVKIQPTVIPLFSRLSGFLNLPLALLNILKIPAERGSVVIKLGLSMYSWFEKNNFKTPEHTTLNKINTIKRFPKLTPDILSTAIYHDAVMPYAERIGLELVLDSERQSSRAHALNYCSLVEAAGSKVVLQDNITGNKFTIEPGLVVNAAGPWIDEVNARSGNYPDMISGTKGSHIILDNPELHQALQGHMFFFENYDHRFVVLNSLKGKVMVGSSDIYWTEADDAICSQDEINYFLNLIPKIFPNIKVEQSQIVFHFSGVRPLPSGDITRTGQITRDHSIVKIGEDGFTNFPILCLIGGKWTTYRALAEMTTNKILAFFNNARLKYTTNLPIGGGMGFPEDKQSQTVWKKSLAQSSRLPLAQIDNLFERYGTRCTDFADFIIQGPDQPLDTLQTFSRREIIYLIITEKVVHLDDFLFRRTLLAMTGQLTMRCLQEAAGLIGETLGWDQNQVQTEIKHTLQLLRNKHGVNL